jgi:pimeloyl-ACP methyl ester carboxylesterase
MVAVFRSEAGKALVHERYTSMLRQWPAHEQIRIQSCQGETFIVACGRADTPPLVLFHGGSTTSVMWWREIDTWSRFFRVYAVDMIGEPGFSAPSRPPLASDDHARWLDDVWTGLQITRASIVAASQGGWLALDFAIRRPEKVRTLCLIAPGGVTRQRISTALKVAPLLLMGSWGRRKAVDWAMGLQDAGSSGEDNGFYDFFLLTQTYFVYRTRLLPVFTDAMLRTLKVPVLAILGGKDVVLDSAKTKRRLEALVPQSQVVFLSEAGHGLPSQALSVLEFLLASIC